MYVKTVRFYLFARHHLRIFTLNGQIYVSKSTIEINSQQNSLTPQFHDMETIEKLL